MARMPAVTTAVELPSELPTDVPTAPDARPAHQVEDDSLAVARGIVFGLAAAFICWMLIGVAIWIALRVI
jgi:hypothetical protein